MAKRKNGAAALKRPEPVELNLAERPAASAPAAHSTTGTYNAIEATFFKRGDLGIIEPPIYLPREPMLLPLVGVLFLAGLTALILL